MVDFDKLEEISKRVLAQIAAAPPEKQTALIAQALEFYAEQARLAKEAIKTNTG